MQLEITLILFNNTIVFHKRLAVLYFLHSIESFTHQISSMPMSVFLQIMQTHLCDKTEGKKERNWFYIMHGTMSDHLTLSNLFCIDYDDLGIKSHISFCCFCLTCLSISASLHACGMEIKSGFCNAWGSEIIEPLSLTHQTFFIPL